MLIYQHQYKRGTLQAHIWDLLLIYLMGPMQNIHMLSFWCINTFQSFILCTPHTQNTDQIGLYHVPTKCTLKSSPPLSPSSPSCVQIDQLYSSLQVNKCHLPYLFKLNAICFILNVKCFVCIVPPGGVWINLIFFRRVFFKRKNGLWQNLFDNDFEMFVCWCAKLTIKIKKVKGDGIKESKRKTDEMRERKL